MRYNGIEYSSENYERINKIITKIIKDAGNFHGIPITRITYKHIEFYCTEFYDYKYILQELSDNATAFLGKLIRENGQTFIMINDNKNIPFEKKIKVK